MPANITGLWGALFDWPLIGIHSIVTQDGKLLSFGTDLSGNQGSAMYHDLWDPVTGTHTTLNHHMDTPTDIFCANAIIVPGTDKILIAGGDARPLGQVNFGVADVNVFNTTTLQITPDTHGKMSNARWYATSISLTNGEVLVLGRRDIAGVTITVPEVYTPGLGWRALANAKDAEASAHYNRAFLNTDGNAVYFTYTGKVMQLDTAGAGALTKIGTLPFSINWESPAIQFAPGKILMNDEGRGLWVVDINGPEAQFTHVADLDTERNWSNMTVLADGKVMINGGSTVTRSDATAIKTAVIWDPETNALTAMVDEDVPRLYHSSAVLLPDGTVLSMGGGGVKTVSADFINRLDAQIYKPGYLFDAASSEAIRPVILATPDHLQSGTNFSITVDNAADITKLTFVKNGAATHDFNMNAGFVNLAFTQGPDNTLVVTLPDYHHGVTAGSWMLFAWNAAGVPSVAPVLEIDPVFGTGAVIDADNMLTNGSFETAATVRTALTLDDLVGWHSTRNNFELWKAGNSGIPASDGRTVLEIDAERGTIWQSIHTKVGQDYDISFDFSGRPGFITSSRMEVLWNGVVIGTISPTDATFKPYTFSVTGTGGNDQLAFRAPETDTDKAGGYLDHVMFKADKVADLPNLIVNGDMEALAITSPSGWQAYTNTQFVGWQNLGANNVIAVQHAGSQMLDLDPEGARDELFQLVHTVGGTVYTLSFDATSAAPGSSGIDVLWNGAVIATIDSNSPATQNYAFAVTGTGLDKLAFRELPSQNNYLGAYLDNVVLMEGGDIIPNANLVTDGNLQALKITSARAWQSYSNAQMPGWKNLGADKLVHVKYLGSQMLDLDPTAAADEIYQTVHTKAGLNYTLTFDAIATKAESSAFAVLWNGTIVATVDPSELARESFSFEVTGTTGQDKLSFREISTQSDGLGAYIDNVKLLSGTNATLALAPSSALASHNGNHVMGTAVANVLRGTSAMDHIMGMGGNDLLVPYGGDDTVDGGTGSDTLRLAARPSELMIIKNKDSSYDVMTSTQTIHSIAVEKIALQAGAKNFGTYAIAVLAKALTTPIDAAHNRANLLSNGSFESIGRSVADGASHFAVLDAAVPGWASSKTGFDIWHDGYHNQPATTGHNVVQVDAGHGSVSQKIATQADHIYRLEFDFAGQTNYLASSAVQVVWNGHVVMTLHPSDDQFQFHALSVIGTGGKDTLTFQSMSTDTDRQGGLLDHITLHDFTLMVM
jgi:hypothetical protein